MLLQPFVLRVDVADEEIRRRYPLLENLLLIRLCGRIAVEFENQLHAFRFFGRNHGEPFVRARLEFVFLLEAENAGVELQGLVLIVDEDARQFDLHGLSFLLCVGLVCVLSGWRFVALPAAGPTSLVDKSGLQVGSASRVGEGTQHGIGTGRLHTKTITVWLWFVNRIVSQFFIAALRTPALAERAGLESRYWNRPEPTRSSALTFFDHVALRLMRFLCEATKRLQGE